MIEKFIRIPYNPPHVREAFDRLQEQLERIFLKVLDQPRGFRVWQYTAQSIVQDAWNVVAMDEVVYNQNGSGWSIEDNAFFAPEDGLYHFDTAIQLLSVAAGESAWGSLLIDSDTDIPIQGPPSGSTAVSTSPTGFSSATLQLAKGQRVDPAVYHTDAVARNTAALQHTTWMMGHQVRR